MTARWLHFGRWPSGHDLDLILDAEEYDPTPLVAGLDHELCEVRTVSVSALGLPPGLLDQAIAHADGLPLDLFLDPWPDDFSVAAWIEAPYRTAVVGWRATLGRYFFMGYRDLTELEVAS